MILISGVVVLFGVAAVAAALHVLWRQQERIVYQPPRPPGELLQDIHIVRYEAEDGQPLMAYLVGDSAAATRMLIAFHGNAVEARWMVEWARELNRRTGWTVLLPEYRGYAGLGGAPSYTTVRLDARAAHAAAKGLMSPDSARIAFFGHSIGTAVATELAVEHPPEILLLQSPLSSAKDMARIVLARPVEVIWKKISRVHYDTVERLQTIEVPVWVAHGRRDLITPLYMGERVYGAAKVKGEMLIVRSAGHNNVPERGGDEYWKWVEAGLRS